MRISCEYTVFDGEKQDFCLVRACSWKEAFLKALDRGFVARDSNSLRPRTGTCSVPESTKVFNCFQSKHI